MPRIGFDEFSRATGSAVPALHSPFKSRFISSYPLIQTSSLISLISSNLSRRQDVQKHTTPNHADMPLIQEALASLHTLTMRLNEAKRQFANREIVTKLMRSISGCKTGLLSDKQYLMEGDLDKIKKGVLQEIKEPVYAFLFKVESVVRDF